MDVEVIAEAEGAEAEDEVVSASGELFTGFEFVGKCGVVVEVALSIRVCVHAVDIEHAFYSLLLTAILEAIREIF